VNRDGLCKREGEEEKRKREREAREREARQKENRYGFWKRGRGELEEEEEVHNEAKNRMEMRYGGKKREEVGRSSGERLNKRKVGSDTYLKVQLNQRM
jgi:hypothetical protein